MRRPTIKWLLWAPVGFAAADLLLMLVVSPELVRNLHHNADVAGAEVVGALYDGRGPGSTVTLGTHPWYESLWFMRATAWLPAKRELWVLGPFVFSFAAIAALVRTAWILFGVWAGAMVAAVLLCASSAMRIVMFTLDWHGGTLVHAVILCVVLVAVTWRAERLSVRALVVIGVVVAAVTAPIVSDRLALATAIGPFAAAALVLWWRTGLPAQRRVAVFALATTAAALLGGELAARAMEDSGVAGTPGFAVRFADYTVLGKNVEVFFAAFTALGGGVFFGRKLDAGATLHFVQGVLTLTALGLVVRRLWAAAPRLLGRARAADPRAAAREAYIAFWSLALVAVVGAFLVTDVSYDVLSSRYLAGAFLALAALVPVLLVSRGRARWLLAAGLTVYTALAFGYHLTKGPGRWSEVGDLQGPADRLADYARANGLEYGYGGFDEAPVVTWLTDERVKVFPVIDCGPRLCRRRPQTISSWYRPRPGVRTFLVTYPSTRSASSLKGPYAPAGRPLGVRRFGPLTVYVYGHDIAAEIGP